MFRFNYYLDNLKRPFLQLITHQTIKKKVPMRRIDKDAVVCSSRVVLDKL